MEKGYVPFLTIAAIIGVLAFLGGVILWQTQIYKAIEPPAAAPTEMLVPSQVPTE